MKIIIGIALIIFALWLSNKIDLRVIYTDKKSEQKRQRSIILTMVSAIIGAILVANSFRK